MGEEEYKPYMRPPLSKDMWFTEDKSLTDQLKFKTWSGRERSVFFEKDQYYCQPGELVTNEKGGVAVATGRKVTLLENLLGTASSICSPYHFILIKVYHA